MWIQTPGNIFLSKKHKLLYRSMRLAFSSFSCLLVFIYSNKKYAGPYLCRLKKIYCEFIPTVAQFAMTAKAWVTKHQFTPASKYCHSVKLHPLKYTCRARDGNSSSSHSLHYTQGYLNFFISAGPGSSLSRGLPHAPAFSQAHRNLPNLRDNQGGPQSHCTHGVSYFGSKLSIFHFCHFRAWSLNNASSFEWLLMCWRRGGGGGGKHHDTEENYPVLINGVKWATGSLDS